MKLSRRHLATAAALATVSAGIGAWLADGVARQSAPAVDYTVLNGTRLNFAQLKGKVVLVNFWATSCTTCVREMPQVVAIYQKYHRRGYDTLAVAMEYDAPAAVADFAESRKLPFAVTIDNTGEIAARFGDVKLTPTLVLINKRGEVVKRYAGEPDFAALQTLIDRLLVET